MARGRGHQQPHHDQRRRVGIAQRLQRLHQRDEEERREEERSRRHRGQAGARALADAGGGLDERAGGGGAHQPAEHAGGRVHHHRALDVRQVAPLVEEAGGRAQAHQRAQRVEETHQEQRQQHGQEGGTQHSPEVEVEGDGSERIFAAQREGQHRARGFALSQGDAHGHC